MSHTVTFSTPGSGTYLGNSVTYTYQEWQWSEAKQIYNQNRKKGSLLTFYDVLLWYARHNGLKTVNPAGMPAGSVEQATVSSLDSTQYSGQSFQQLDPKFSNTEDSIRKSKKNKKAAATAASAGVSRYVMKQNCKWNLPPHKWSMPFVNQEVYGGKKISAERRGKIFYYTFNPQDQAPVTIAEDPENPGAAKPQTGSYTTGDARKYGFQFMWNPEGYSTNTTLQPDVTPSKDDIWVSGAGMFPGVETVSFTVRLDRTNDFACFRRYYKNGTSDLTDAAKEALISEYYPEIIYGEYDRAYDRINNRAISKLDWLMKFGTLADLEYLYRVFTDIHIVNKSLGDGFVTADVGFIGFFIVCIEVGPVYYLGYVTGVNVNHTAFTEDYIPIRTDVTITANIMANGSDMLGISGNATASARTSDPSNGVVARSSPTQFTITGNADSRHPTMVPKYKPLPENPSWGGVDPRG